MSSISVLSVITWSPRIGSSPLSFLFSYLLLTISGNGGLGYVQAVDICPCVFLSACHSGSLVFLLHLKLSGNGGSGADCCLDKVGRGGNGEAGGAPRVVEVEEAVQVDRV